MKKQTWREWDQVTEQRSRFSDEINFKSYSQTSIQFNEVGFSPICSASPAALPSPCLLSPLPSLCPCLLAAIIYPQSVGLQSAVSSDWLSSVWSCRGLIARVLLSVISEKRKLNLRFQPPTKKKQKKKRFPGATPLLAMETTRKVAVLSPRSIRRAAICLRLSVCVCGSVYTTDSECVFAFVIHQCQCQGVCVCVRAGEIDECVYTKTMHVSMHGWFSVWSDSVCLCVFMSASLTRHHLYLSSTWTKGAAVISGSMSHASST